MVGLHELGWVTCGATVGGLSTARGRAGVLPGQPVNGQRTEQLQ